MAFLSIDTDACVKDGLCREICPGKLIELDENGYPVPVAAIESECVNCGHCVAICPTNCLTHTLLPKNEFVEIVPDLEISAAAVAQFIKSRRSIRNYKKKPVPRATIEKLIDIVRYAPSGHNDQDVRWSVYDQKDDLKNIADKTVDFLRHLIKVQGDKRLPFDIKRHIDLYENGNDMILREAPVLLVAHCVPQSPMAATACTIALATLELAAKGLGLGTCWAGFVMLTAASGYGPLMHALDLPEGRQFCGAMVLGYPKLKLKRIPARNKPVIQWKSPA